MGILDVPALTPTQRSTLDSVPTTLAAETTARNSADSTLTTGLANEIGARQNAISAEATSRANADTTLTNSLASETAARIAADATKADLINGTLDPSQLPAISLGGSLTSVDSEAQMLALDANVGDLAKRTDLGGVTFYLTAEPPSTLANWTQFSGDFALTEDLNTEISNRASGDTAAIATAASDATSKANAARTAAISAAASDATTKANAATASALQKASNLSDLPNAGTARTNLGLGSSATQPSSAFDAAGAATTAQTNAIAAAASDATSKANAAQSAAQASSVQKSSNLSDLSSASTARSNLGLGTAATQAATAFDPAGAASDAQAAAASDATAKVANETSRATAAEALKFNKENVFQVQTFLAAQGATADTAIDAAVTAAVAVKGVVDFGQGVTYNLSAPHDFPVGTVGYRGNGVVLNCSSLTSSSHGYAIRFIPGATDSTIYNYEVSGLRILGPINESNNLDGVFVGRPTTATGGNVAGASFSNIIVRGFRDNWFLGNQSWLNAFRQCSSQKAWRRGINIDADVNAGEMYLWLGGVVADCRNSSGTAVGVYTSIYGNADSAFIGSSFDYNDIELFHQSGHVSLDACHVENMSANPMFKLSYTGSNGYTSLLLNGCKVTPTESGVIRSYLIESTFGDNVRVTSSGTRWELYGHKLDVFKALAGFPTMVFNGGDLSTSPAPDVARPGETTNLLCNPGFETNNFNGWSLQGTVTYTVQSTAFNSGTRACKIVGIGTTGSTAIRQVVPVAGNTEVWITMEMMCDAYTAGTVIPRVQWLDSQMNQVNVSTFAGVTGIQGWTRMGGKVTSPANVAFMNVQAYSTDLNGTVYIDDVYAATLRPATGGAGWVTGTSAGQLVAGNDSRVVNATQKVSALDLEITDATKGIILVSPAGTRYRITVANGGALTTTAI